MDANEQRRFSPSLIRRWGNERKIKQSRQ
jgi:hypothetical protein